MLGKESKKSGPQNSKLLLSNLTIHVSKNTQKLRKLAKPARTCNSLVRPVNRTQIYSFEDLLGFFKKLKIRESGSRRSTTELLQPVWGRISTSIAQRMANGHFGAVVDFAEGVGNRARAIRRGQVERSAGADALRI
jgi:hypothetical protein